ncbi:hypothetical protein [Sphingobium sp. YR657]|uniref:hypothetical protein n=1 Tax=Sphingobium sp. YR657 TaxID=1884366 RepID=UPI001587BE1B|nr:hypothetical protein [Sphingobium sp. YR657]
MKIATCEVNGVRARRIDYLLLNPATAKRLEAADIDQHKPGWDTARDHALV